MGKKRLGYNIKIDSWFGRGSNFYIAYLKLMKVRQPQLILQCIVLCSFVIETYLKVLKAIEGKERPLREHNLLELFDDLSEDSKEAMTVHWLMLFHEKINIQSMMAHHAPEIAAHSKPPTLRNALIEAQEAFVAFRYGANEDPTGPITTGFSAFAMPDILLSLILDLRPDLNDMRLRLFALLEPEASESQVVERHYKRFRYTLTYGKIA